MFLFKFQTNLDAQNGLHGEIARQDGEREHEEAYVRDLQQMLRNVQVWSKCSVYQRYNNMYDSLVHDFDWFMILDDCIESTIYPNVPPMNRNDTCKRNSDCCANHCSRNGPDRRPGKRGVCRNKDVNSNWLYF